MPSWVLPLTTFETFNIGFSVVFWSALVLALVVGGASLFK
jgi:hypothetical protein